MHVDSDPTKKFVMFDILLVYKDRSEFLRPQDFVKTFENKVEIPQIIYQGNLNDDFIQSVRNNNVGFPLVEGVICKGTETKGSFRGKIWMCKIKTTEYLNKLKVRFGDDWEKYSE